MDLSFLERATSPGQYDKGEVDWAEEGSKQHYTRRMIFEAMLPHLGDVSGKRILDIGSGLGWLSDEITALGGRTLGIEPSVTNIKAAKAQFPNLDFQRSSLEDFRTNGAFDAVVASMVFEHLGDLRKTFKRIRQLLNENGKLVIVTGDHERFTRSRPGVDVKAEQVREGESATRSDYDRAGVIYDVFRTPELFISDAEASELQLVSHEAVTIPEWLKVEEPRYKEFGKQAVFQVLSFKATK